MKKITSFCLIAAFALSQFSCSTEEIIADEKAGAEAENLYKRRVDMLMQRDFSTLFTYTNAKEAQAKLPGAFEHLITVAKHRLTQEKGATDAIIKVVVEHGKGILWEEHFIDVPNERLVELIRKKEDSHIMYIGSRDNYPELYGEITKLMENNYRSLGTYQNMASNDVINNYLKQRLSTSKGSAEFRVRVTDNSAEVYALR